MSTTDDCRSLAQEGAEEFLDTLLGSWEGRAIRTPRGPLPYAMDFNPLRPGSVLGKANPGAATHYWNFYLEEGLLKLRFLTTFQGNRQPLYLTAKEREEHRLIFTAEDPNFFRVELAGMSCRTINVEVFLRGAPHVFIMLNR